MANIKSAKKRARQSEKSRQLNASRRSMMRTHIKRVLRAVAAKDITLATEEYRLATSIIDRLAKTVLHKNTASRYKSRLHARVKAIASN